MTNSNRPYRATPTVELARALRAQRERFSVMPLAEMRKRDAMYAELRQRADECTSERIGTAHGAAWEVQS